MIKVHFDGDVENVIEAADKANAVLADPHFYAAIRQHGPFDLSAATSDQIAAAIQQCNLVLTVVLYKPRWWFSKALGCEDPRQPDKVFMNVRRLNRSVSSIVGTIVHEAVHVADATSPLDFDHGDNSPVGKDNTAPYWIGNLAVSFVEGTPGQVAAVDHAPHEIEDAAVAVA